MIAVIYKSEGGESLRDNDTVLIENDSLKGILQQITSDEKILKLFGEFSTTAIEFFSSRSSLEEMIAVGFDNISAVASGLACAIKRTGVNPDTTVASCNVLWPMFYRADGMLSSLNDKLNEE